MAKAKKALGQTTRPQKKKTKANIEQQYDYRISRLKKIVDATELVRECLKADLNKHLITSKDYKILKEVSDKALQAVMFHNRGFEVYAGLLSEQELQSIPESKLLEVTFVKDSICLAFTYGDGIL